MAWREQLARERCTTDLLDGETLDAAHGLGLLGRRLRRPGLVVDLWPGATARGTEKKRRQRGTEHLGAEDTTLEDGERQGL